MQMSQAPTTIGSDEQSPAPLPSIFDDGDVYDLVGKDVPYGLDYYVTLALEADGPVLDVACGTGRILLPCLQAGVDIEGLDLFEPMLRTLQIGLKSLVIWALADNEPAVEFYKALGGKAVARSSERFGERNLEKVAFAWNN